MALFIIPKILKGCCRKDLLSLYLVIQCRVKMKKCVDHTNVMVHENTYIEGDKSLANNYHHSHIEDVFTLIKCPRSYSDYTHE